MSSTFTLELSCAHCGRFFFPYFHPRHHCRRCGEAVCATHSKLLIQDDRDSRVCSDFYSDECQQKHAATFVHRAGEKK